MSEPKRKKKSEPKDSSAVQGLFNARKFVFLGTGLDDWVLAVGLGILIFWRPWIDGIVRAEFNSTFLVGTMLLFALWSIRQLARGNATFPAIPVLLFTGFLATAWTMSQWSVQYYTTFTSLLVWTGYLMVFVMAAGLRFRAAISVLLGFVLVTSAAEAIWSVIHLQYSMPETREFVKLNPAAAQNLFGHELNDALVHRLNSNRAFGTLLFANALASWMVAAVPLALFCGVYAYQSLRGAASSHSAAKRTDDPAGESAMAGVLTASALFVLIGGYYLVFHHFRYGSTEVMNGQVRFVTTPLSAHAFRAIFYAIVIPVLCGAGAVALTRKYGARCYAMTALCTLCAFATAAMGVSLWLTYSRGGLLSLALACVVTWLAIGWRNRGGSDATAKIMTASMWAGVGIAFAWTAAFGINAAQAQQQGQAVVAGTAAQNPFADSILRSGTDMTLDDMLNPNTVKLRYSYWDSAVQMASANLMTGVGLGNFGTVYSSYQKLGAGDVKQVHNDFLQILCETGLLGFVFFTALWVWFAIDGVRRLRRVDDAYSRWISLGLFAGITGFLFHSLVDFPFVNPSLATLSFLMLGMFYAVTHRSEAVATTKSKVFYRATGGAGLALLAILVGANQRVGQADAMVGDEAMRLERFQVAGFLIAQLEEQPQQNPVNLPDRVVALLIPDQGVRQAIGTIYYNLRAGDTTMAPLGPGAPVPPGARLVITNVALAKSKAREYSVAWTTRLADADAAFPHDPEFSTHISIWFDMLWSTTPDQAMRLQFIKQAVEWAERSVDRSPYQVAFHDWLGRMYWRWAMTETEADLKADLYKKSHAAKNRTIELYPTKPEVWIRHADHTLWASREFETLGLLDLAAELKALSEQSRRKANELNEALAAMAEDES